MASVKIATRSGDATTVEEGAIRQLESRIGGQVLHPGDPGYDDARTIWNAMIDRRPALVVRCAAASDVAAAVSFARDQGLLVSVRGGGHNIAGTAVADGGLMLDLSAMRAVTVDPDARRAVAEPGATLADFDAATQEHALATPMGINSTTGVAGLTLGGGFGWLTRKFGMTVDNLVSADVVTADGSTLRASESENADLFWAIRGGGGNFGVVTRFEFQLHPLGPDVLSGLVVYPLDQAGDVLPKYADFMKSAPDELSIFGVLRQAPPLPFLPESVHFTNVVALGICYAGDPAEGEKHAEAVRSFGTPVGAHVGAQPYTAWQQAFDPLLTPGARNYWKSHNLTELTGDAIDTIVDRAATVPTFGCELIIAAVSGAPTRVAPDATAYAHRQTQYVMNVHGRWESPGEDGTGVAWARDVFRAMAPFASAGVYVNFLTEDERDRLDAAFGPNYQRLQQIKRKYDPDNLFRHNQNIPPA